MNRVPDDTEDRCILLLAMHVRQRNQSDPMIKNHIRTERRPGQQILCQNGMQDDLQFNASVFPQIHVVNFDILQINENALS